ncbi:hypothetical protein V8E55_002333, partial [Tylopilus felleus]
GDMEVPEFQNSNDACNLFVTDVFYIGNTIKKDFLIVSFNFMKPLISGIVQQDPAKHPKMDEVVAQFNDIQDKLSCHTLYSHVVDVDEDLLDWGVCTISYWKCWIGFLTRGIPAIP